MKKIKIVNDLKPKITSIAENNCISIWYAGSIEESDAVVKAYDDFSVNVNMTKGIEPGSHCTVFWCEQSNSQTCEVVLNSSYFVVPFYSINLWHISC